MSESQITTEQQDEEEKNIQVWRIKQVLRQLDEARGGGTSMISLMIPPKDKLLQVNRMLAQEHATAVNIKDRVNKLSVLGAIASAQSRLKLYKTIPPNGLAIFCGTVEGDKKLSIDFEPLKPLRTFSYLCDNRFHTEALHEMLSDDEKFGFIIMDGSETLLGLVCGNNREVLHKLSVDLPKKHGRGGQSALRFARLRLEKRHNYVRKVAELAKHYFIANDRPNVKGLVLAGMADLKMQLFSSDLFDPRLKEVVIRIVDISYGGENGFNQAIALAANSLSSIKLLKEKDILGRFFEEIAMDTGMVSYGIRDTLRAWDMGALNTLVVWEDLDLRRVTLKCSEGQVYVKVLSPEVMKCRDYLLDPNSVEELTVVENISFLEWVMDHYKEKGCKLELLGAKSPEGVQFVDGFEGVMGFLRWKQNFAEQDELEFGNGDEDEDDDDEEFM